MDTLSFEFITEGIIPFIGDDQFRFVAAINRTFYQAYTQKYPSKVTSIGRRIIHS
jgi:hypothetical protein